MTESGQGTGGCKLKIPSVSTDDLFSFHESHFSQDAVRNFGGAFMKLPESNQADETLEHEDWEEEDDLGYYPDGVKRTLTDEQIEIFRHSELEALRKKREKQLSSKPNLSLDDGSEMEAGEDTPNPSQAQTSSSTPTSFHSNKKRKKGNKRGRSEPKPDLRKRTWDVVDKGLDTLDYD